MMLKIKTFPILYDNNTKTNKPRFWRVFVEEWEPYSIIVIEYGFIDGKITEVRNFIDKGKNIGKKNETTHLEQAIKEAESKWNKKKDTGFLEKNEKSNKIILPMLALDYNKRGKDIIFPAYTQCKLDGVRCIYNENMKKLQSRVGKIFPHLDHILLELENTKLNLDGELYSYTLSFQEFVGLVKKQKMTEDDLKKILEIKFIVYDFVDTGKNYSERLNILKKYFSENKFEYIELLNTKEIKTGEDIVIRHDECVKNGYEGLIIRNKEGYYEEKNRSKNLQKFKNFQDEEYKIVDFTEGEGIEKGLIIFICETPEGKRFSVRPSGTHLERKKMFRNGKKYIGKYLSVKFFELTEDKIPRFPTTLRKGEANIRDYE